MRDFRIYHILGGEKIRLTHRNGQNNPYNFGKMHDFSHHNIFWRNHWRWIIKPFAIVKPVFGYYRDVVHVLTTFDQFYARFLYSQKVWNQTKVWKLTSLYWDKGLVINYWVLLQNGKIADLKLFLPPPLFIGQKLHLLHPPVLYPPLCN